MTATPSALGGVKFASEHNAIPGTLLRPLAASAQVGRGQLVTVSPTTGYASLNDGTTANQIAAGIGGAPVEMSDTSATAALAFVRLDERHFSGLAMGTSADAFTDADWCKPFFIKDENTVGKLAYTGADATLVKRSIGGLVFGLDKSQNETAYCWSGPIAWQIARAAIRNDAITIAADTFALAQGTTRAECNLPRTGKFGGVITQVRVAVAVTATDGDTDYWTFAVSKRSSSTPGTAVSIASKATKTTAGIGAMTNFVYYDLTLTTTTADLDVIDTDMLTVTATAATGSSAAKQVAVEVIGKVA